MTRMSAKDYRQFIKRKGDKKTKSKQDKDMFVLRTEATAKNKIRNDGFASGYEKQFNELLKMMLAGKQILSYEYEPLRFVMSTKPKATYKPDFILVNNDKSVLVVEIKGFLRSEARERFLWAASVNTDKRFVMIVKKDSKWCIKYDINQSSAFLPFSFGGKNG